MEDSTAIERLADAAQRLATLAEQEVKAKRDEQLGERWGPSMRRAGLGWLLGGIPGLAGRFEKVVPDDYVARTDEGTWEIACPCGEAPALGAGELCECECGRWFLHDGRRVHVYKPVQESVDS